MLSRVRTLCAVPDIAHQMRFLSLQLIGAEPEHGDDTSVVSDAYSARVPPLIGDPRFTCWSLLVAAPLTIAATCYAAYAYTHVPFDPHDIPAAATLERNLSQWTSDVAKSQGSPVERELRSEPTRRVLGEPVAQAVLDTFARGLAASRADAPNLRQSTAEFTASQVRLNQLLLERKLPIFVDGTLIPLGQRYSPLLMTYYVEEEEWWQYRDRKLRTVSAWRMDPMRLRLPALGYVREGNPVAVISFDLIETVLVLYMLPSLAEREPAFVFDEQTRFSGNPTAIAIESRLGNVLRQHFDARHIGANARRLGQLLAARRNLIAKWRRTITGFPIRPPERYLPERNLGEQLESLISRADAISWNEIQDALSEPAMIAAFEEQRTEWTHVVKRHELQHLIDQTELLVGIPVGLARRLSVDPATEPEPYTLFGAARAELSAYLAEVAHGPYPRLSLVALSTAVFDRSLSQTPHHFAALTIFDGLIRALGLADDGMTYEDALVRVVEFEPEATRAKARELYESWFGRATQDIKRVEHVEHAHYRH
jgi:hypothetical protein